MIYICGYQKVGDPRFQYFFFPVDMLNIWLLVKKKKKTEEDGMDREPRERWRGQCVLC